MKITRKRFIFAKTAKNLLFLLKKTIFILMKSLFKPFALVFSLCALLAASAVAQTKTLYFLPPNDPEWLRRTPHIYDIQTGSLTKMTALPTDNAMCGWYRMTFPVAPADNRPILFYRGSSTTQDEVGQLGRKGTMEDPDEWPLQQGVFNRPMPTLIKLDSLFTVKGTNDLYFDPTKGDGGWFGDFAAAGPAPSKYCSYEIAAIIYDTDETVRGNSVEVLGCAFSSYNGTGPGCGVQYGDGIRRGVVQNTLGEDKKPVFNSTNNSGWSQQAFDMAFRSTPYNNVQRCYNMPFKRSPTGSWEFDSDTMTSMTSTLRTAGGFYPRILYDSLPGSTTQYYNSDGSISDYAASNCIKCRSQNNIKEKPTWTFPGGNDVFDRTVFNDGALAGADNGLNVSDWGADGAWPVNATLRPKGNNHFCFESHSKFIYEGGEEFIFRGDDDIWVFINNKLAIDLGGCHLGAPGYVNLDTLGNGLNGQGLGSYHSKLIKGNEYDLDIFFCDRRSPNSNVRISTNMYVTSNNTLFKQGDGKVNPAEVCMHIDAAGGDCTAAMDPTLTGDKCGGQIASQLEYYVVRFTESSDETKRNKLDKTNPECYESNPYDPNEITCYGGIKVNLGLGTVHVTESLIVGLGGMQIVFAKLKDNTDFDPVQITTFRPRTNVRIVWGNNIIYDDNPILIKLKDEDGNEVTCSKNPTAVTGQLVPICVAIGDWNGGETQFTVSTEDVGKVQFTQLNFGSSTTITPFKKNENTYLEMYYDSGKDRKVLSSDQIELINGYRVLYVTGSYSQSEKEELYEINVPLSTGSPVNFKSIIPYIRWTKADGTLLTNGENRYGKWEENPPNPPYPVPEWTGKRINLYLEAYNWEDGTLCETCTFNLGTGEAYKNDFPGVPDNSLISFGKMTSSGGSDGGVKDGKAEITISGKKQVFHPDSVIIKVRGQSNYDHTELDGLRGAFILWKGLEFRDPPVPRPISSEIYDSNGDGIGDSLIIVYNRGFDKDSLPAMVEVHWGSDVLIIGKGKTMTDSNCDEDGYGCNYELSPADRPANLAFWKKYLRISAGSKPIEQRASDGAQAKADKEARPTPESEPTIKDSLIIKLNDPDVISSGPINFNGTGAKFDNTKSFKEVRTLAEGAVYSSLPFEDIIGGMPQTTPYVGDVEIDDKIPAVLISAKYMAGTEAGCGGNSLNICTDVITLNFSEPVEKRVPGSPDPTTPNDKNLFEYVLRVKGPGYDTIPMARDFPKYVRWSGVSGDYPGARDSVLALTFERWRGEGSDYSYTPMAQDSVRFTAKKLYLQDANGNPPNPKEIGVEITGKNPFVVDKIVLGSFDPNNDYLLDSIAAIFERYGIKADPRSVFSKGNSIAVLPVPKNWSANEVRAHYPGTIGIVFRPDVSNILLEMLGEAGRDKIENVSFNISAFYHTNLGEYVVSRKLPTLMCDDPIFPGPSPSPSGRGGDCRNSDIYVAWNMKDIKGRWVGTGAYVGIHNFNWAIHTNGQRMEITENTIKNQVDMFGARRTKKK